MALQVRLRRRESGRFGLVAARQDKLMPMPETRTSAGFAREVGQKVGQLMLGFARGARIPLEGQTFGLLTVSRHVGSTATVRSVSAGATAAAILSLEPLRNAAKLTGFERGSNAMQIENRSGV